MTAVPRIAARSGSDEEMEVQMAGKLDWPNLTVALVVGVVVGVGVSLMATRLGMPQGWVGPVTGGLTGGLVPLIYRLRTRES